MDWEYWLSLIVNVVIGVLAYKQLRLMRLQTQQQPEGVSYKLYWPVFVCLLLMLGTWIPYYFAEPTKSNGKSDEVKATSQPYEGRVITQWGTGEDETCQAVVNGRVIMKFKDTFGIALVCGFKNSRIDKLEDTDISISSIFTITPGSIEISIPLSQQMTKAFKDRVERANKEALDSKKEYAKLKTSIWFEVVLLPKSVNTLDIHKLADVPRHGGQIPSLGIIK